MDQELKKKSRALIYVLRHDPGKVGIDIDPRGGWVRTGDLLTHCGDNGLPVTKAELKEIVETDDKRRFTVDGRFIRAAHGHSIDVDLQLSPVDCLPPNLYHGTSASSVDDIKKSGGVEPRKRKMVHLSKSKPEAFDVGRRHSDNVAILDIRADRITGQVYKSDSGIFLTEYVPFSAIRHIEFHNDDKISES